VVSGYHTAELELARTARDARTQVLRRLLHGGAGPLPADEVVRAGLDPGARHHCVLSEVADPVRARALERELAVPGGLFGLVDGRFDLLPFLAALVGGVALHSGTNILNEVYDVRKGIDTIVSPRASHAIVKGRMRERTAIAIAGTAFLIAVALGVYLIAVRGPVIIALGLAGLIGGWGYTAPPLQYKYRAFGVPLVFLLMGPLMTVGGYFATTGTWSTAALVLSIPIGLLVAAILHGNEWRDISEDTRAGIVTLSSRIGRSWAHYGYVALVLGAYISLGLAVAAGWLAPTTLLAILSLPFLALVMRSAELGASGQARAIAMIDLQTARLHLAFGSLLVLGILLAGRVGA